MDCGSVSGREKRLSVLQIAWIGCGAHITYFSVGEGGLCLRKKGPYREADQSSISSVEVKDG
jgi:hypothetical protein